MEELIVSLLLKVSRDRGKLVLLRRLNIYIHFVIVLRTCSYYKSEAALSIEREKSTSNCLISSY
jgi:hypothetical protein